MTRGQNSLTIDLMAPELEDSEGRAIEAAPLAAILVLPASADEMDEHERILSGLDKQVKGKSVWRTVLES
jgi:DNA polymerase III subunit epsilon